MWEALKIQTSYSPDNEVFKRFREKGFPATPHTTAQLHTKDPQKLGEFAITQATKHTLDLMKDDSSSWDVVLFTKPNGWGNSSIDKIAMPQEYISQGIASKSQLQKISRLVDFCIFVFNLWWFNCPLAASAPHQDGTRQLTATN